MKKIIAIVLMTVSASAFAWNNGYRGGYYGYRGPVYYNNYGYNNNWVAPALAGAVVGGLVARSYYAPPPVVYAQPQVIYTQPSVTYVQQSSPAPAVPPGYHWQYMMDPACDCYKYALVPN